MPAPASAAQQVPAALADAWQAWDEGRYVQALEGYLAALDGPDGAALKDAIAELTGELYEVRELTADGAGVSVSPDGLYGAYVTGPEGSREVVVVDLASGAEVDRLAGDEVVLGPDGTAAVLRWAAGDAVAATAAALDAARAAQDREAFLRALREQRYLRAAGATLAIRDVRNRGERPVPIDGLLPIAMTFGVDGRTLFLSAARASDGRNDIYAVRSFRLVPDAILTGRGFKTAPRALAGGRYILFERPRTNPGPLPPDMDPGAPQEPGFALVDLVEEQVFSFAGRDPVVSADGRTLAFVTETDGDYALEVVDIDPMQAIPGQAMRSTRVLVRASDPIRDPAVSPDGRWVAFRRQPFRDWEVFVVASAGGEEPRQVTYEIQHDLAPVFVDENRLLIPKGEGRHMRSFLYDLTTGRIIKLFHNNTVRTIAPEYEWAVSPDGRRVLIVAERDGDTVSPERGVYLLDLTRPVSLEAVRRRLLDNLDRERTLMAEGERMFAPVRETAAERADAVSVGRIYGYERDLFRFGSKYVGEPGNLRAVDYLARRLTEFGYAPALQWFEARGARTANVIARLEGTVDPQLVCTVSSHFDSVRDGPGADDDTSGTAALLETARVLAEHPLPITVEFAFFTGEEAGLLGSREYVRRAQDEGKRIVCALNNDMIGWSNDHRLDNTIRYSNAGIRDVQHAAAALFSDLITYDARYYKNTDAHAYYDAYGDIVGGIGSYPVLGNPNYHRITDRIETINHRLVAEVARTTVASIVLLASSPARPTGLAARRSRVGVQVTWDPAPESDVVAYVLRYERADGSMRRMDVAAGPGAEPRALLEDARPGGAIEVRAVNGRGLESWDWARTRAP
ncbi:MAG: M20/M25/M40 family metallo-hydrolase [Gemmatimonadetes bacterium]|nr:MAG: M20/M25/M40 family metallo-hydrolase [Gemmatimonadota bacterium]